MSAYFTQHVLHHQDFGGDCVAWCGERAQRDAIREWFHTVGSAHLQVDRNGWTQPCPECWAAIQEHKNEGTN